MEQLRERSGCCHQKAEILDDFGEVLLNYRSLPGLWDKKLRMASERE
jgi:hypothetical protein